MSRDGSTNNGAKYLYPPKSFRRQTLNGRLHLKHGADRREILPKRVSDDPRQVNFRPKKKIVDEFFWRQTTFFAFMSQFSRPDRQTDLKIESLALFRFKCTYYEVCTTKNRRKYVRLRRQDHGGGTGT